MGLESYFDLESIASFTPILLVVLFFPISQQQMSRFFLNISTELSFVFFHLLKEPISATFSYDFESKLGKNNLLNLLGIFPSLMINRLNSKSFWNEKESQETAKFFWKCLIIILKYRFAEMSSQRVYDIDWMFCVLRISDHFLMFRWSKSSTERSMLAILSHYSKASFESV